MNIGYITSEYPHLNIYRSAGIGSFIYNISHSLRNKGCSITVFVYGQKHSEVFYDEGVRIVMIEKKNYTLGGFYFYRKFINTLISDKIKEYELDLIEAADWTGVTAFMKFKIPLVVRLHGTDCFFCNLEGRKQKYKNFLLENLALKNADTIVGVSNFVSTETKRLFSIEKNVTSIHNFVNESIVSLANNDLNVSYKYVLYFGSIIRKKGVLEISSIIKEVYDKDPSIKFIFIGSDVVDYKTKTSTVDLIKSKLSSNELKSTKFLGKMSYQDTLSWVKNSDLVLLPSYAEAMPMTWIETMKLGKALIGSNIGWSKEIINHKVNGYSFSPKDSKGISKQILHLMENRETREYIERNALKTAKEDFSEESLVQKNIDFYKSIIK
ncbi:glycosyltransferase family 4 protein [Flavobacteriaceae bacterium]|nr:glycosyltransferase family 4 protein [Flavobacteriaceae bacterium]